MWRWLRTRLLGISAEITRFERRGFAAPSAASREHLETAASMFVTGYNRALAERDAGSLGSRLNETVEPLWRGFAFEGAAMALALLDGLPFGRGRLDALLGGAGACHTYMVHVGVGWALARLRRLPDRALDRYDPLQRWLVVDGYAFHQAFFDHHRYVDRAETVRGLSPYGRRAFDQGLGRCLWFVRGADTSAIASTVSRFEPARRADLWSGVGLAAAYAGGAEPEAIASLPAAADAWRPQLAQGAAFAAKARIRAGFLPPHTELACRCLASLPAERAAELTDSALADLPPDGEEPAFEVWRTRIQASCAAQIASE